MKMQQLSSVSHNSTAKPYIYPYERGKGASYSTVRWQLPVSISRSWLTLRLSHPRTTALYRWFPQSRYQCVSALKRRLPDPHASRAHPSHQHSWNRLTQALLATLEHWSCVDSYLSRAPISYKYYHWSQLRGTWIFGVPLAPRQCQDTWSRCRKT